MCLFIFTTFSDFCPVLSFFVCYSIEVEKCEYSLYISYSITKENEKKMTIFGYIRNIIIRISSVIAMLKYMVDSFVLFVCLFVRMLAWFDYLYLMYIILCLSQKCDKQHRSIRKWEYLQCVLCAMCMAELWADEHWEFSHAWRKKKPTNRYGKSVTDAAGRQASKQATAATAASATDSATWCRVSAFLT